MGRVLAYVKKNRFLIAVGVVLLISFAINYSTLINNLDDNPLPHMTMYKVGYVLIAVVLAVAIFFVVKKVNKKEIEYHKIFLIFAILMGSVYLLLSPMFTGSDETVHYYRIYEITGGGIATPINDGVIGSEMPASLAQTFQAGSGDNTKVKYRLIPDMARVSLNKDEKILYNGYSAASFYSPISYAPQIIGFQIGKTVNAGPYFIGMLGRLMNLVFYVLIGYFAIKIMPKGKLFYLLVLLSPNLLQTATTLSADALTNSAILLLIALIMELRLNDIQISRKQELLICVLSIVVSLCKISYAPLVALIFLLKKDQYKKGAKEKYIFSIAVLVVSMLLTFLWMRGTGEILNLSSPNSELQKAFVLSQPIDYLIILFRTIAMTFTESVEALFVGSRMYHSQLIIPAIVSFFYVGLVAVASMKKEKATKKDLTVFERGVIVAICATVFVLIVTALYLQATSSVAGVGYPVVVGLQGRYYIPIILCLPFIMKWKKQKNVNDKKMLICCVATSMIVWFHMLTHFIV